MVNIAPFKALFFSKKAGDINELVTPPYDSITQKERERFRKNTKNVIHALMPESPSKADEFLSDCVSQKIMVQFPDPAVYLYSVIFTKNEKKFSRFGIVCLLELTEYEIGQVIPHEHTFPRAVEEIYNVLKATNSNLNPIFVLYPHDPGLAELFKKISSASPLSEAIDPDGVIHRIWQIKEEKQIEKIVKSMQGKSVVIADGHHRYEAGLHYSVQRGSKNILAMLVDSEDPGLKLSTHSRILTKVPFPFEEIIKKLKEYFEVEQTNDLPSLQKKMAGLDHAFGLYMGKFYLLKPKVPVDKLISEPIPRELKELDVSVLHRKVLPEIFGIHDTHSIEFCKSPKKAIEVVNSGSAKAAFILNPVSVETVIKISALGEIMPPKSTYFFPKPLSGFVMYKADI